MIEYWLVYIFVAVFGAILGSFANVVILRWHADVSLLGRSACPSCHTQLQPRHLVPVLSWLIQRGKCAFCRKNIHIQYPVVELLAAIFALIAAARHFPFAYPGWFFFEAMFSISLIVPVVMDARWEELPVEYLVGVGILAAIARFLLSGTWPNLWDGLALVVPIGLFWVQFFFSKGRALGEGDVWFGGMMGAALGWPFVVVALYLAYILGASVALVGLLLRRVHRGSRIPFAPALAAGTLIALWYGDRISHVFAWW